MAIIRTYVVPHPPLAVPAVGRGREAGIASTMAAYARMAAEIRALEPETLVISSPHAPAYRDYIQLSAGSRASGSFAQFGAPRPVYEVDYDRELVRAIAKGAVRAGVACGTEGEQRGTLDHGTLVPLHFIREAYGDDSLPRVVRIGISRLSPETHYAVGRLVQQAAASLGRRVVYVASGDCSHKLTADGPYGFNPAGPEFDAALEQWLADADFLGLLMADADLCERAAECGMPSFQMMAGALDGTDVRPEVYSHEGPFGVGYLVASFEPTSEEGADPARRLLERVARARDGQRAEAREREGVLCTLARASIEGFILHGRRLDATAGAEEALAAKGGDEEERARLTTLLAEPHACFVSLKEDGELRGCIGTLAPTQPTLAAEIVANAISASTRDPRFRPVRAGELDSLVLDVDVLSEPEPTTREDLDPSRYGVIVSTDDGRRGVLLPDLAGVDTVEEQIDIASRKAHISLGEPIQLQRFTVERHL